MFSQAAAKYWKLYCHVGGGSDGGRAEAHGLGCWISQSHVLTAAHVLHGHDWPVVSLRDGIWKCSVAKTWPELDIALIRKGTLYKGHGSAEERLDYTALATAFPSLGQSLGYIGWLSLPDESGKQSGRTYVGQGHVAFIDLRQDKQPRFAVAGSAVQEGFSGGPVFTAGGDLVGVLVAAFQYVRKLQHPIPDVDSLPLVSPVAKIRSEILTLIDGACRLA